MATAKEKDGSVNSDDIIHNLACDFAEYVNKLRGCSDPADEYLDPIREVFGEAPTQESVIATYTTKKKLAKLITELKSWCESKRLTDKIVRDMLRRAIINNFGRDAIK